MARSWLLATSALVVACGSSGTPSQAPVQPAANTVPGQPAASPPPAPGEGQPPASEPGGESGPPKREEFKATPKHQGSVRGNFIGFPAHTPLFGQPSGQELRIHFLDVDQGDSTLVECPGGERILVDGGSGISEESEPEKARDHLRATLGTSMNIDMVIVSHPDRDHYNALPYLLDGLTIGHIQVVGPASAYSGWFVDWLAGISANKKTRITQQKHDAQGSPNTKMNCGPADVFVLSAAATGSKPSWKSNTSSLVLMVSYRDFEAILTADATFETETKILGWYQHWWLDAELLKVGHHGSATTSSDDPWVNAVAPDIAIVSSGFANEHGHPRKTVVERIAKKTLAGTAHKFRYYRKQREHEDVASYGEAIYGTGTSGTIVVGTNGSNYWVDREK